MRFQHVNLGVAIHFETALSTTAISLRMRSKSALNRHDFTLKAEQTICSQWMILVDSNAVTPHKQLFRCCGGSKPSWIVH
jgi:hypothetical protein